MFSVLYFLDTNKTQNVKVEAEFKILYTEPSEILQYKLFFPNFWTFGEPFLPDAGKPIVNEGILFVLPRKNFFFLHLGMFAPKVQSRKLREDSLLEKVTKILDEFPAVLVEYSWKTPSVLLSSVTNSFFFSFLKNRPSHQFVITDRMSLLYSANFGSKPMFGT